MKINRRKLLSLLGASPAIFVGSTAAKEQRKETSRAVAEAQLEGLNPHGMPPAIQLVPMAPRLASLDGKTTRPTRTIRSRT